jgi:hypothetical protein
VFADRRRFDERRDLPGGGRGAGADGELAVANDGRGEDDPAFVAHHRQALAGDGLLVDHGVAVDDLAVDRNHLTRIDDDQVADRESRCRDRGHRAVADDPGSLGLEFQKLAHRLALAGRGQIADPIAELDQPGDDGASHRTALQERGADRQRIEEIDIETALAPPHPPGPQCDRIGIPQHQRKVDRRDDGIGGKRHQQRHRRQGQRRVAPDRGRFRRRQRDRSARRRRRLVDDADEPLQVGNAHHRELAERRA